MTAPSLICYNSEIKSKFGLKSWFCTIFTLNSNNLLFIRRFLYAGNRTNLEKNISRKTFLYVFSSVILNKYQEARAWPKHLIFVMGLDWIKLCINPLHWITLHYKKLFERNLRNKIFKLDTLRSFRCKISVNILLYIK